MRQEATGRCELADWGSGDGAKGLGKNNPSTRSHVRVAGLPFTFESEPQQTADNRHVIVLCCLVKTAIIVDVREFGSAA